MVVFVECLRVNSIEFTLKGSDTRLKSSMNLKHRGRTLNVEKK